MVTVHAVDAVTGATLAGTVTVNGAQSGATDVPFSLTVPAHRVLTRTGWEWDAVLPTGTVSVPGYTPGTIAFETA
jgi:hypothetical protein